MNRMIRTALLATGLFSVALLGTGCSSTNSIDSSDLRSDWTPELYSVAEGHEQFYNNRSIRVHNTWRQVRDDWSMIWLQDRNYRMTKFNLP